MRDNLIPKESGNWSIWKVDDMTSVYSDVVCLYTRSTTIVISVYNSKRGRRNDLIYFLLTINIGNHY